MFPPTLNIVKPTEDRTFIAALPYWELSWVSLRGDTWEQTLVLLEAAERRLQSPPALHSRGPAGWSQHWASWGHNGGARHLKPSCLSEPSHFSVSIRHGRSLGLASHHCCAIYAMRLQRL